MAREKINIQPKETDEEAIKSFGNVEGQTVSQPAETVEQDSGSNEGEIEPLTAAADYESEEAKGAINKRLAEQRIFEERQEAKRKAIERAFMSDYEKKREEILLEKKTNGQEEVLDENDITKLMQSQRSVNDRIEIEKEKMLLA